MEAVLYKSTKLFSTHPMDSVLDTASNGNRGYPLQSVLDKTGNGSQRLSNEVCT